MQLSRDSLVHNESVGCCTLEMISNWDKKKQNKAVKLLNGAKTQLVKWCVERRERKFKRRWIWRRCYSYGEATTLIYVRGDLFLSTNSLFKKFRRLMQLVICSQAGKDKFLIYLSVFLFSYFGFCILSIML